jgi:hypothetical protein
MDLNIFLSSTSRDLGEARQKILRLLSVIPADLVRMETFGSDETKPVDFCLKQVRRSNLFVGVYAERYGTIDPTTGLSLTDLEYREALAKLKEDKLLGLLVYLLDPSASWKVEYIDRDAKNVAALQSLKEDLKKNHTVTFFRETEELALNVLRDVLRKIGIGPGIALRARSEFPAFTPRQIGPLGMEHYTERDAHAFRGREEAIAAVCGLVDNQPLALLIGDSGIGKTSLIEAGIFPTLRSRGWAVASARPLDDPDRSIPPSIWNSLMKGIAPQTDIGSLVQLIATAHHDRNVLIVIDQFEDIMSELGTSRAAGLLSALRRIYTSPSPNLHIVICYRGDAEPKVGRYLASRFRICCWTSSLLSRDTNC